VRSRSHDIGNPAGGFHSPPIGAGLPEPAAADEWLAPSADRWQATALALGVGDPLRFLALRADASSSQLVDIASLWLELSSATQRIVDYFFTEASCFVALTAAPSPCARDRRLSRKKLDVLERVLLRGGQKPVATELGLAPSTVAIIAGNCLRAMGLDHGASRAPLPLTLSIHAVHGLTALREARTSQFSHGGSTYSIIRTGRPELGLEAALSPAEFSVTRLLVEGNSHAQIAALRSTSVRTVANQLAAAFHKLGVSGRCELVCQLVASRPGTRSAGEPTPNELEFRARSLAAS
jgi:DNA-binding NarL/FixJ family response regulator